MCAARWERVTIVGCGLVGASFALALKRAGACARVAGRDTSPAVLDEALARGIIDEVDTSFESGGVSSSDLIYLATPVGGIVEFLHARTGQLKEGAVVTDAGSTKTEVCRAARESSGAGWRFVGGHPVAGSHRGGISHARADLFDGAPYVLASTEDGSDPAALAAMKETLASVGASVRVMTASEHDRALALVSHLPQLLSSALASTVEDQPDAASLLGLSGAGFRDVTRLAASPWSVWRDILATNPREVASALEQLLDKLTAARDELRQLADGGHSLEATAALFNRSSRSSS
ncbi:MAG TPA: prephenate dehydrogenase/arogenate dehydrogenase family protein [Pyrinomonadaceae bacterium]|jgi:prephenate dehydrogenase|nr:prephenate dehydrogenase/arogenate dehydrogenase family protein [Pyrinomonadaceae bacterium]